MQRGYNNFFTLIAFFEKQTFDIYEKFIVYFVRKSSFYHAHALDLNLLNKLCLTENTQATNLSK